MLPQQLLLSFPGTITPQELSTEVKLLRGQLQLRPETLRCREEAIRV